ncbi:MAG: type I methionyl aminopeptidase [Candidatus Saganbacteria bacterium]|nr:type I methionyl aminopeptidase [Candidatus Saganbacteria bacterium]
MTGIKIKTAEEIEKIRQACRIVARALKLTGKEVQPGVTTEYLDSFAERLIREEGADPVFIGYRGYRHATCMSVNEEIVHGIPGNKVLKEGDIIGVDIGSKFAGYCGDTAATFPVGEVSKKVAKLLKTGQEALIAGIRQARAGNHLGDVSAAVQKVAESKGYSVVRELYGHGIGADLHEDPLVPNFGRPGEGIELKEGMVLAIEPMLNLGGWQIRTLSDGWTIVTADKSLSCHFEHTVLITGKGPEILTRRD